MNIRIFFLLFLLLLQACDRNDNDSIRFGLNTSVVTLDPRYITDAVSDRVGRLIYQRLTDFDDNFNVIPKLADWQLINDKQYRFTLLKESNTFHNGMILTSDDIKATFESLLSSDIISPHRAALKHIDRIDVIDPQTVDFHLSKPDPLFPGRVNIGILPKELIDSNHPFNTQPIGSGPFRLFDWASEERLIIERIIDRQLVSFITVKDPNTRVLKLAHGEIDLMQNNLSPESIRWLKEQENIFVDQAEGNTFTYIGLNMENALLKQKLIRKAIAHAIDREAILDYVMTGLARKAESLLTPTHWAGHSGLLEHEYDPEKARRYLKEAGYQNEKIAISYKTSNNPFRVRLGTVIQHQLEQVGFNVSIQSYDWGTFYGDIKSGRFQMYSLSWVGLNLPDIFRYVLHSESLPPHGANRGRYRDEQADNFIDLAEEEMQLAKQAEHYIKLQEHVHEELPFIPLWYENNVAAYGNDISGYRLLSNGHYDSLVSIKRKHNE